MFKKNKKNEKEKETKVKYDPKTQWVCPVCKTVNALKEDFCTKCLEARKRKRDTEI